ERLCAKLQKWEEPLDIRKWMLTTVPVLLLSASLFAKNDDGKLTNVPAANAKIRGVTSPTILSPELQQVVAAQGSTKLENPSALTRYYGYDNDVLAAPGVPRMLPAPGAVPGPSAVDKVEAQKTEPDKNTYLILKHQNGPDPSYDYGTHFLFQGHE